MSTLALLALLGSSGAGAPSVDLANVRQGGSVVYASSQFPGGSWSALHLLDGRVDTGWSSAQGQVRGQQIVIALAAPSVITAFGFDTVITQQSRDSARRVRVSTAIGSGDDPPPAAAYAVVLETALEAGRPDQRFVMPESVTARWLRLEVLDNYGDPGFVVLRGFHAFGAPPTTPKPLDVSGLYRTERYGAFRIVQGGSRVRGCYEFARGTVDGTLSGNVLQLRWMQDQDQGHGTATLSFHPGARAFSGLWWVDPASAAQAPGIADWDGVRESTVPGGCPHSGADDPSALPAEAPID